MTMPTTADKIRLLESVASHLETAVSLLRAAYQPDPQLGIAAQHNDEKWNIEPLVKALDRTRAQVSYLQGYQATADVECAECGHQRGLHGRLVCHGVIEVDPGLKPKPCRCMGFLLLKPLAIVDDHVPDANDDEPRYGGEPGE